MNELILSTKSREYAPHPETQGLIKGVIVDVTPLKMMTTKFGDKNVFKIVYETEHIDTNGRCGLMFSAPYSPSLHEKSSLRRDLKKIRGRDLTAEEEREFRLEEILLGFPVQLIVTHELKGDRTYAQISFMQPDKSAHPLKPSGSYVRVKDRPEKEAGGTYRKASDVQDDDSAGREDWQKVKVHIGKYAGQEVGDLPADAIMALHDKWIPSIDPVKPKADDKRLDAAIKQAVAILNAENSTTELF